MNETKYRSIWEEYPIELEEDFQIPDKDGYTYDNYHCKHIVDGKIKLVVVGTNEGGYNSVGMCGECLLELLTEKLPATPETKEER